MTAQLARRIALVLAALPAAAATLPAQRAPQPLFATDSVLELRIESDLRAVFKERGDDGKPYPATVTATAGGGSAALPAELSTRGHFRLKRSTCGFPPLRLRFAKDAAELAGTPFAGQRKLKLVTHCQPGPAFEENVVEEYLLYRAYNLLTDTSFRARLARVTYVDTGDPRSSPVTRYALFIEDDDRMAERLGGQIIEQKGAMPGDLHPEMVVLLSLYAYMIGNTDWSLPALHNIRLVRAADDRVLPVPYDFDWSGVVGAPYARPNEKLGIKTVFERVYMGPCVPPPELAQATERFTARREAIYALFRDTTLLDRRAGERATRYLDEFYKTLQDPRAARREFAQRC